MERITALMDNINIKNANYNHYREEGGMKHSGNSAKIENLISEKVKVADLKPINNLRLADNDLNKVISRVGFILENHSRRPHK